MKPAKINKKFYVIIAVIFVLVILAVIAFLMRDAIQNGMTKKTPIQNSPVLSFNSKVGTGWWAGDNFNSRENVPEDYQGATPVEKLPVANRVINQGGSEEKPVNGCFVMFAYYDYPADTESLRIAWEDGMTSKSELVMQRMGSRDMTMNTTEGEKTYKLYQYGISGPGSDTMMKGVELGYVNLSNGYVSVEGDCQEPTQLDSTLGAIPAISLSKKTEDL